jgi:hypothetical protein
MESRKTKIQEKLQRVVELMAKKYISDSKNNNMQSTRLQEYGRTVATEALREMIDDYQLHMEMLIDEHYGELDVNQFKKQWFTISNEFEKQFSNILKNMSK